MDRVIDLSPDYDPIEEEMLGVHDLSPQAAGDDEPLVAYSFPDVKATTAVSGSEHTRTFTVEIEYRPDEYTLNRDALRNYLGTFRAARITQESMAEVIHQHIVEALKVDEVFVGVKYDNRMSKMVRVGQIT